MPMMMCPAGRHFYDPDKYDLCPTCEEAGQPAPKSKQAQSVQEQWEQRGFVKGEQQGFVKGERQGESHLLFRLLQRRFGADLPAWVNERLQTASTEQLEAWAVAFVDAQTLDAIFNPEQSNN